MASHLTIITLWAASAAALAVPGQQRSKPSSSLVLAADDVVISTIYATATATAIESWDGTTWIETIRTTSATSTTDDVVYVTATATEVVVVTATAKSPSTTISGENSLLLTSLVPAVLIFNILAPGV